MTAPDNWKGEGCAISTDKEYKDSTGEPARLRSIEICKKCRLDCMFRGELG